MLSFFCLYVGKQKVNRQADILNKCTKCTYSPSVELLLQYCYYFSVLDQTKLMHLYPFQQCASKTDVFQNKLALLKEV